MYSDACVDSYGMFYAAASTQSICGEQPYDGIFGQRRRSGVRELVRNYVENSLQLLLHSDESINRTTKRPGRTDSAKSADIAATLSPKMRRRRIDLPEFVRILPRSNARTLT